LKKIKRNENIHIYKRQYPDSSIDAISFNIDR
jgi:hypothetical protein